MKELLNRWKEGAGVLLYFGFLAYCTPKAEALGWGYQGLLFCVVTGALLVLLLYLVVKGIADYLSDHREEMTSFREYMGLGKAHSEQVASLGTGEDCSTDELDALLATNPYAVPELFDDDKYTRLLPIVEQADNDEDTRLVDDPEDAPGEEAQRVAAIIGENPRRRLRLADNYQPDANDPLATGVLLIAMPGAGKTAIMARFLEEYLFHFHLATVAFDLEGDLCSIVEHPSCPRGMVVGPENMPSMAYVVKHRIQLVVDLQQCRKPGEAFVNYELAGQVIARTVKALLNAQTAIAPHERLPVLLALDETHMWTPQNPPSYLESKTYKDLLDTLTVVATRGRKYGVVPFLAAQRIARVHKDIIAGCETRILGKTDLDTDIKRYREYVSPAVISDAGIRSLGRGQMVVCMHGKRLLVQFYNRQSTHRSHTPHLTGALNQPVERIPPDILAMSAAASRQTEAVAPPAPVAPALPRQGEPSRKQVLPSRAAEDAPRQPLPFPRQLDTPARTGQVNDLQAALDVFQPGMTYRELGKALGWNDLKARAVWRELKQRGLLRLATEANEPEPESARAAAAPTSPKPAVDPAELEKALQAYDAGNTTIDALAVALGMTPWTVRPLYAAVKKVRKNAG
jgi:hypothetical protein